MPTAIIVAAQRGSDSDASIKEELDELTSLLATLGIVDGGRITQRRTTFVARSLLGEGKIAEIRQLVKQTGAQMVVFANDLTPMQARNLEEMIGVRVYDRTAVILQIFFEHARTRQARTQLEIARLEYLLPRLTGAWTHFQRQTGGAVNSKGMGETQIEIDRRRARDRISKLQKQLQNFQQEKKTQSKQRQKELKVALVGYTNSGKTSLMNALTRSEFRAEDVLFATLDANIRVIDPKTRPRILLSDTVGFIKNLPDTLFQSFKTTLDHVLEADLLLHVVDATSPAMDQQMMTTEKVLDEIGASAIPTLTVFNKIDLLHSPLDAKMLRLRHRQSLIVSALDLRLVGALREKIFDYFQGQMRREQLAIPHGDAAAISLVFQHCVVIQSDYTHEDFVFFEVRASETNLAKLSSFIVPSSVKNIYEKSFAAAKARSNVAGL